MGTVRPGGVLGEHDEQGRSMHGLPRLVTSQTASLEVLGDGGHSLSVLPSQLFLLLLLNTNTGQVAQTGK